VSPNRSRPFVPPAGRRIVGTPAAIADHLGVTGDQVAAAITAAGLEAWGRDARQREVFRVLDVEQALGRPAPARGRGDSWRVRRPKDPTAIPPEE
jgi:hypothetical protein